MKIAIISDTHFGMRRLGFHKDGINLIEQDNYNAIRYATTKIQEGKPAIILHGGDIFESDNPNSHAMVEFLDLANAFDTPFYGVAGNHDNRKLLKSLDKVTKFTAYTEWGYNEIKADGWSFFFLPHLDPVIKNGKRDWTKEYELFAKLGKDAKGKQAILITHGIIKSEAEAYSIDLSNYNGSNVIPDQLLSNFKYCIIGHNHTPSIRNIKGCKVIVPGSTVPDLFKTGLHNGLGALFLDSETGELERSSFIPRDIKKLTYIEEDISEHIQDGGIYSITDSSDEGIKFETLQEFRNSALLITVDREDPNHIRLFSPVDKLPTLVEYSTKWDDKDVTISEEIREDLGKIPQ